MIPTIGIMIACYIITRMLQLLVDKRKETNIITMLFAVITVLVSLYSIYWLFKYGSEVAQTLLR